MFLDNVLYDEAAASKYLGGEASPISTRTM
jgi:hypothetical protein